METTESTIKEILKLGEPNIIEKHKSIYTDKTLTRIQQPDFATHEISSLAGVVDLFECLAEQFEFKEDHSLMLVVDSHDCVEIKIQEYRDYRSPVLVRAEAPEIKQFNFGRYYEAEEFSISILTLFEPSDEIQKLFTLSSKLTNSLIATAEDNQISQKITIQSGVSTRENVTIKPVWNLQPYRTFPELVQPESPFLFRLKPIKDSLPQCALFEIDGGKWRIQAKQSIADWLKSRLPEGTMIVL